MHASIYRGVWHDTRSISGTSCELEFALNPKHTQEKHASDLSPKYPPELVHFEPLDSADGHYVQLHKPNDNSPFKDALLYQNQCLYSSYTISGSFPLPDNKINFGKFERPSLAKLNDEIFPYPWANEDRHLHLLSGDDDDAEPVLFNMG